MKRIKAFIVLLFISLLFSLSVYASGGFDDSGDNQNYYMTDEGTYKYSVKASAAAKGTPRYRTVGLIFRLDDAEGFPLKDYAFRYVPVYQTGNPPPADFTDDRVVEEYLIKDGGTNYYKAGAVCTDTPIGDNMLNTECEVNLRIMKQIIYDLTGSWTTPLTKLKVSHVFQISDSKGNFGSFSVDTEKERAKLVFNIDRMKHPQYSGTGDFFNWSSTTEGLIPNYYDIEVNIRSSSRVYAIEVIEGAFDTTQTLNAYLWDSDPNYVLQQLKSQGGVISARLVIPEKGEAPDSLRAKGLWRSYSPIEYTFNEKITNAWGDFRFNGSYFIRGFDPNPQYVNNNPALLKRSTNTGLDPLLFVGLYTPETPIESPPVESDLKCTAPALVNTLKNSDTQMQGNSSGVLKAETRSNPKFDVSKGIPVLENLYGNVLTKQELVKYEFNQYEGECTWEIDVTKKYDLTWYESVYSHTVCDLENEDGTCASPRAVYTDQIRTGVDYSRNTITVTKPYSFWKVGNFALYKIASTTINNGAITNGSVTIPQSGVSSTAVFNALSNSLNGYFKAEDVSPMELPSGSKTASGSSKYTRPTVTSEDSFEEAKALVEKTVKDVQVANDQLSINGTEIFNSNWTTVKTANPKTVSVKGMSGQDTLYRRNMTIPTSVKDGVYDSTGFVTYSRVKSSSAANNPATITQDTPINSVTVRTPVVNYSTLNNNNQNYNQLWGNISTPYVGVLGRDLTLNFGNSGQHLNITGYGDRDYSDYVGTKRVRFSFPVKAGGSYYAANSWIPVTGTSLTVNVPTWATEGVHTVRTEAWATNAQSFNYCGVNYNGTLGMECAVNTYDITLVGRAYGFTLYDIGDFRYESVFRNSSGTPTGFIYRSGLRDKDGGTHEQSNKPQQVLPIRPGSHLTQAATTPHNGYAFSFYFNTVGQYYGINDGINIVPTFYFVPKNGGTATEVDLYYNTSSAKMIKVGGSKDTGFTRSIKLSDPVLRVSEEYRKKTLETEYDYIVPASVRSSMSKTQYVSSQFNRTSTLAKGYKDMRLNYTARTLIGSVDNTIGVNANQQRSSVQRWFGQFSLPIDPYVVAAGTNLEQLARTKYGGSLTGKEEEFLNGGYIIVNFKIYAYKNGNTNSASIAYDASSKGNANMWNIERQIQSSTSYLGAKFSYRFGDIIMFESDFSVKDDYK